MCSADAEGTLVRDGPRILLHGLLILKLKEVAAPLLVQRWVEEPAKVSRKAYLVLTVSGQQLVAVEVGMGLSLATRLASLLLHLLLHLLFLDAAGVRFARRRHAARLSQAMTPRWVCDVWLYGRHYQVGGALSCLRALSVFRRCRPRAEEVGSHCLGLLEKFFFASFATSPARSTRRIYEAALSSLRSPARSVALLRNAECRAPFPAAASPFQLVRRRHTTRVSGRGEGGKSELLLSQGLLLQSRRA